MAKSGITAQQEINRILQKNRQRMIRVVKTKGEQYLDAAARLGVNASKDKNRPDTWTDRTGNLRESISHFLENTNEAMTTITPGKRAIVFAGMEYAPFVHFREGYRVLVPPPPEEVERIKRLLHFE